MCDCLIIGFNDYNLRDYISLVKGLGINSGAYRDLSLALVTIEGEPYRALDIFSRFHYEGREEGRRLHNIDFLWPTITYLGSYLARHGFTFDYVNLFQAEKDRFANLLRSQEIRTVAITTTLYVIPEPVVEIIEFIRRHNRTTKIIVGGPFIGNQLLGQDEHSVQRFFSSLGADIYVDSTEGELALVQILGALKAGRTLEGIANVSFRDGGRFKRGLHAEERNPLEGNLVDYSLFPPETLGRFVSVRTAKSCPFACSFCGFPQRAGKYRYLPLDLVEQELNHLRDVQGVDTITFLDDTFNVPRERFREILRLMIRRNYGFKWNCFLRSDHTDEELIRLMAEAGCEGVFLGAESGSDTILEQMNKTARTKNYRAAIPVLKECGIFTYASLIVGFPGETIETFRETFRFIEEAQPDSFRAQLWYADPLTPVWKRCAELGIRGSGFNWSHHTMDSQTACGLVEQMFLSIRHSTWLPQNGFELWSVFYLKRFGMSVNQIKGFLDRFNAIIRERLVCPGKPQPAPKLVDALKASCQFDRSGSGEPACVLFSGREYADAEQFWIDRLSMKPELPPMFGPPTRAGERWRFTDFNLPGDLLDRVQQRTPTAPRERIALAAYGVLLSRWKVRSRIGILRQDSVRGVFPLMLNGLADLPLAEAVAQVESEFAQAAAYAHYASHIMAVQDALKLHPDPLSRCEVAFLSRAQHDAANSPLQPGAGLFSGAPELRLILEWNETSDPASARVHYDADAIAETDIADLVSGLQAVLAEGMDEGGSLRTQGAAKVHKDWNFPGSDELFRFS